MILVSQHFPVKHKSINSYEYNRLEEIITMRNGIIVDTLTIVDNVEVVKCDGVILEAFEGFSVLT